MPITCSPTKNLTTNIFPKNFPEEINLDNLPDDLRISTMTITCNFNTLIDTQNVGKYIDLDFGNIVCVKYGSDNKTRSLIKLKKINKKSKKKHKNFYNQATIIIETKNKRGINVKLFKNGSIQMTGCKDLSNFVDALTTLCLKLKKNKAIYDRVTNKIIKKPFVNNPENMDPSKVYNIKIRMINSNFHIGFLINREKLFEVLKVLKMNCTYEPCIHACVNIKYVHKGKDIISIFVFESGSIIITGAKNKDHIVDSYKFITKLLHDNYDIVVKNDIDKFLDRPDIKQLILECSNVNSTEVNTLV